MTPRTLTGVRLLWLGYACGLVGGLALLGGACTWLSGCAALEADAVKAQPKLRSACTLVADAPPFPYQAWVDFACDSLEAADDLLARIPSAVPVAQNVTIAPDGGTVTSVTIRCPLAALGARRLPGGIRGRTRAEAARPVLRTGALREARAFPVTVEAVTAKADVVERGGVEGHGFKPPRSVEAHVRSSSRARSRAHLAARLALRPKRLDERLAAHPVALLARGPLVTLGEHEDLARVRSVHVRALPAQLQLKRASHGPGRIEPHAIER